jgi:membrane protein
MMPFSTIRTLVVATVKKFMKDDGSRLSASLAFYITLSLAPLFLVLLSIVSFIYGPEASRGELQGRLQEWIGEEGTKSIQEMLAAQNSSNQGIWMAILGFGMMIYSGSKVFVQLQEALNTVWDVEPNDQNGSGGLKEMVRDRLVAILALGGMALLIIMSLVFEAVVGTMGRWLEEKGLTAGWTGWARWANLGISFLLTFAMFALVFKVLPEEKPSWRHIWVGAGVTAILFTLGKYLIGLYLVHSATGSAYGAAGSFVVLLFWIYFSAQIFLIGAEWTAVYAAYDSGQSTVGARTATASSSQIGHSEIHSRG